MYSLDHLAQEMHLLGGNPMTRTYSVNPHGAREREKATLAAKVQWFRAHQITAHRTVMEMKILLAVYNKQIFFRSPLNTD